MHEAKAQFLYVKKSIRTNTYILKCLFSHSQIYRYVCTKDLKTDFNIEVLSLWMV